jgi:hypothetical protein
MVTFVISIGFVALAAADRLSGTRQAGEQRLVCLLSDIPLCVWVFDVWLRLMRVSYLARIGLRESSPPDLFVVHGLLLFVLCSQAVAMRLSPSLRRTAAWPNDVFRLGLFACAASVLLAYACAEISWLI